MAAMSALNLEAAIVGLTPGQLALWGFRFGDRGTHTSRTIMLDELSHLLDAVPGTAVRDDYAHAVTAHNCLGKRTAATRKLSLQRLSELYALDPRVILFRVLRDLWAGNETSRPLLAMLLALARDPLLRASATAVVRTPYGNEFARQSMKDALADAVGDRLNEATLDKVVRNASSSWTQAGHFRGRGRKIRSELRRRPPQPPSPCCSGSRLGGADACCSRRLGPPCSIRALTTSSMWRSTPSGWGCSISSSPAR